MGWVLLEWVTVILRWAHVMAGIAWIGTSFYFVALDAGLKPSPGRDPRIGGESWQVHGGGFYHMQKYLVAPDIMPPDLVWFKWEAYATWLLGFLLLLLTYYANPSLTLIDRSVLEIGPTVAVTIALSSLALGWLLYDGLCRSPLGRDARVLASAGFALLVVVIWGYCHVFSGRGAYIQVGALVGGIMAGNVLMVIIPNQTRIVRDLVAGRAPDPALGRQGKQRSLHNNYLTLPVVFIMISNHAAFTYGSPLGWLVLAAIFAAGFLVRHYFNLLHRGANPRIWLWPAAVAVVAGAFALTLTRPAAITATASPSPEFPQVGQIIQARCSPCHSATPHFDGIAEAPKGVMFDRPEQIAQQAAQIYQQAVVARAMPLGNVTAITEQERQILAAWITDGAKTP